MSGAFAVLTHNTGITVAIPAFFAHVRKSSALASPSEIFDL